MSEKLDNLIEILEQVLLELKVQSTKLDKLSSSGSYSSGGGKGASPKAGPETKLKGVEVQQFEDYGKRCRAKLSPGGWVSSFEASHKDVLSEAEESGRLVDVVLVKKGQYTNIKEVALSDA